MQPGSQLSVNAVEGYPLEDFNPDVSYIQLLNANGHRFN